MAGVELLHTEGVPHISFGWGCTFVYIDEDMDVRDDLKEGPCRRESIH